jgi:protease-4
MKKAAKIGLVLILVLVLVVAAGIVLWALTRGGKGNVPERTILEVNLDQQLIEYVPEDPLAGLLMEDKLRMLDMVAALEAAAGDERVVALVAKIGGGVTGFAHHQELRDAVLRFRESGKPAIAWSDTFGEFGSGNAGYYLATAFDEIYIQPSGDVGLTGLNAESPFIAGTFEKLGVTPRMDHRYEYKNAMNTLTETEFTPAHEEALGAVIESLFDQMVAGIGERRGKSPEEVRAIIDAGPYLGQEAVEAGLVDGLKYRDEVYDRVEEAAGEDAELLYLNRYAERADGPWDEGETIALVYGVGQVVRGKSEYDPLGGSATLGGDSVAAALRQAIDDDKVKAILFRVDSPGGSYVASDTVWRETVRAREAGKPVIVSMSNVAGSGGYFVAMSADKIVAEPGTITGSIGVLGGKLLTRELWSKLGITFDSIQTSDNAEMWSSLEDYDEAGWARVQAMLDRIYEDFTSKVAEGRELPLERVQEIAKGRIWSGADARELGLVDELGGFSVALGLAREAAGLEPDADVRLKLYPPSKSPFEMLFGKGPDNSEGRAARAAAARVLETLRPVTGVLRQAGLIGPEPGALSMAYGVEID